jgi:hypothetical protein
MAHPDTGIDVTPTDNQLYEVEIRDATGSSRHEVGLPDDLLDRLQLREVAAKDVLVASVELVLDRVGRDALDREVDLAALLDRYPELVDQIPARVREREQAQPPTLDTAPADEPTPHDRLTTEVEQEQQLGQASNQDAHR